MSPEEAQVHRWGMTLRDYFAAKAMQATVQAWISTNQYPPHDLIVAENAYVIADAMLEARDA
jgi:hypothetical protein